MFDRFHLHPIRPSLLTRQQRLPLPQVGIHHEDGSGIIVQLAHSHRHGEFPDRYYCQCVHYLAVTGKQRWYLAVLAMGEGFYIFRMTRVADEPMPEWCDGSVYVDDEEITSLMAAETAFWEQHIQTGIPPAVDGEKATSKAVRALTGEILDEDAALVAELDREAAERQQAEAEA